MSKPAAYLVSGANGTTMLGPLLLKHKYLTSKEAGNQVLHAKALQAHERLTEGQDKTSDQVPVYALVSKEIKLSTAIHPFESWDGETLCMTLGQQWVDRQEIVIFRVKEKIIVTSGNSYIHTMKSNRKQSISVDSLLSENNQSSLGNHTNLTLLTRSEKSILEDKKHEKSKLEKVKPQQSEATRKVVIESTSRVSTFLPVNANVTHSRPKMPPPEKPPPIVPPPRSASLQHKPEADEEPDDFVPELLSLKNINDSNQLARDTGKEMTSHNKKPEHYDEGEKRSISLPVRAVSTSGPHFFRVHSPEIDFKKRISSKLSESLPGDEEDEDFHKNKKGTNPLKKFFARKKGKYDPSADGDGFESTLPSFGFENKDSKKKKKSEPKKKTKEKENKRLKKTEPTKAKISKENIIVVKSSGKCLTDLDFTLDGPEIDSGEKDLEKQNSSSDGSSDLIHSMEKDAEDDYNEMDEGGIYANFPTVLRRNFSSGHRVDPPTVPSEDSSESDPENEYNEPEDNDDDNTSKETSSQSDESASVENEHHQDAEEDDDDENYVNNAILLAKMNKSNSSPKAPSSVSSEGSSTNSENQGCYVINPEEKLEEDMTVSGVEEDHTFLENTSSPTIIREKTLEAKLQETTSAIAHISTKGNTIKKVGTMDNLAPKENTKNVVDKSERTIPSGIKRSIQVVDDSLISKTINDSRDDLENISSNETLSAGIEHKEIFLQPDKEAQLLVQPISELLTDVTSQATTTLESSKQEKVLLKQLSKRSLKESSIAKSELAGPENETNIKTISGNITIQSPHLISDEKKPHVHKKDIDTFRDGITRKVTQNTLQETKTENVTTNKLLHATERLEVHNKAINKETAILTTQNTPKMTTSSGSVVTKPSIPPPTKPKPPAWKTKALLNNTDSAEQVNDHQVAPKPKLTSRGSEESINKKLIAGALKELDEFIDKEISLETTSKGQDAKKQEPLVKGFGTSNQSSVDKDYEKFIFAHKDVNPSKDDDSQPLHGINLDKDKLSVSTYKSTAGDSQLGRYERVVSCSIPGEPMGPNSSAVTASQTAVENQQKSPSEAPSQDCGYEDMVDQMSKNKMAENTSKDKIYEEIGDSDDENLSPTSRCFKFHWKKKEKKDEGDYAPGSDKNTQETKDKKTKDLKSSKAKEEGKDNETIENEKKDKKRKKKNSASKKPTSKKESKRDKSKESSTSSDTSEYSDYEVFEENSNVKSFKSQIGSSKIQSPQVDKMKLDNADSYGYEIPAKLDIQETLTDNGKETRQSNNMTLKTEDLSLYHGDVQKIQSDSSQNIDRDLNSEVQKDSTNSLILSKRISGSVTLIQAEDKKMTHELTQNKKDREQFLSGSISLNQGQTSINSTDSKVVFVDNSSKKEGPLVTNQDRLGSTTSPKDKKLEKVIEPAIAINTDALVKNRLAMFQSNSNNISGNQTEKNRKKEKDEKDKTSKSCLSSSSSSSSDSEEGTNRKKKEKKIKSKPKIPKDGQVSTQEITKVSLDASFAKPNMNDFNLKNKERNKVAPEDKESKNKEAKEKKENTEQSKNKKDKEKIEDTPKIKENKEDEKTIPKKEDKDISDSNKDTKPKEATVKEKKEKEKKQLNVSSSHFSNKDLNAHFDKLSFPTESKGIPKTLHGEIHHAQDMNIPVDIPDGSATIMVNDSVRIKKSLEHTNQKIAMKGIDISFKSPSQEIHLKPTQPLEAFSKENVAKPKETQSRDNKMDAMSALNLELNKEQTLPTTDAVSSVFQIPYIQSFSEIDDDPWKDYSALEFGGLSKESPGIKGEFEPMKMNTSDLDTNWMLRTTETADRTTSLPPDHVAPPVPRVRSKLGLYSESVDISKLPTTKISSIKNEETPSQSDHKNSESDSDIYADGTSESNVEQSKEEALKVIVPQLSLKLERVSAQGEESPEDHENDGSKETTNETRDYDHVPVRMRKLVNAKPVFPGLVMSASPTTTSPTASGVFFTKRSTKGPHSGGPEYAQPWEEKKLETLAPSSAALPSETNVTTSSRSSSEPSSGKGSFSGARLSYTSEDMNEEIGFGMGDAHRLNKIDPNTSTKAKTKHKVPEDESKKGNRLKSLTSLFHRKKKDKKDTNHSDEDDNEDDNESNDGDDVSDTKDNEGKTKKRKSDKHKKEKSEKPKKPKKPSKSEKNPRLSQEVEPENVEMTDSNWRPLCRLLKVNDDGSRVLEMSRPQSEPLGIFFKKGLETHKEDDYPLHFINGVQQLVEIFQPLFATLSELGLVVKSFLDKHAKRLFAGLLRVGDEIVEIDDEDICHLTLDEIKDLIQQKESMVLSLRSTEGTL